MVFLFLSDKEIEKLVKKIRFWLKKGGVVVISDTHPTAPIIRGDSFWVKHKVPNNFNYFRTSKLKATLRNLSGKSISFPYYHRSLSKYIKLFTSSSFKLIDLCEPQATKKQASKLHLGFENKNPSYVIFKFVKD